MAFEEVTLTKEETAEIGSGGSFFKFNAIGEKLAGRFVKIETRRNTHFNRDELVYHFKVKQADGSIGVVMHTPGAQLARLLSKANLQTGNAVLIQYTADQAIEGKQYPMKIFSLKIDRSSAPAAAKPPPPPAEVDGDVPF